VRRGQQDRRRGRLGVADDHRTARAGRIEHGEEVVDPLLHRRDACDRIGQAGPRPVEEQQTPDRRKPAQELCRIGVGPHQVEMRDQSSTEDDVDGPIADRLKGDADVPTTGVLDVDRHVATACASPT
jgi:hypothetical protein